MSDGPAYDRYGLRARARAADESLVTRTREGIRALWVLLRTTFRADPRAAIGATLLEILGGVAFAISALWLKVLADAVTEGNEGLLVVAAVGMAGFQGVNWLGQAFAKRHARLGSSLPLELRPLERPLAPLRHRRGTDSRIRGRRRPLVELSRPPRHGVKPGVFLCHRAVIGCAGG